MRPLLLLAILVGLIVAVACSPDETYDYGLSQTLADPNTLFPVADAGDAGVCTTDRTIDASECGVSFRQDIFAASMAEGKNWNCASAGCHGGSPPLYAPHIDNLDAATAYENLASYTLKGTALRYINPCSTDLAASGFSCNMHFTCGIGMPSARRLPDADLVPLEKWLACGAPNN